MFAALAVLLSLVSAASAHGAFPSILDLERDLHLAKGSQLPRDVQASDGAIYHTYYVRAKEIGNGYYDVTVKLDR